MLILAHRGAHKPDNPEVRENTLEAFRAAADVGADGVELDVRRSRDGVLVVHHDASVDGRQTIAETMAEDLPPWVPTLEEALAALPVALVDVEIKNSPLERSFDPGHEVAGAVATTLDGRPGILVSSFNLATLGAYREVDPGTPTGWLTIPGYDPFAALDTAVAGGHRALNPPDAVVTRDLVGAIHAAGLEVVVWTVDDPPRMEELADFGVDVLVTDRPGVAVATLR